MKLSELPLHLISMLIGGIALFLLAVGFLIFFVVKNRSTKPALAMLPLAIFMIGFPAFKTFEGYGFKVEVAVARVQSKANAVEENPADESARKDLESALKKLEAKVSPEKASPNIAETIAQGHLALGNSDRAIKWADVALAKAPNSPTARVLLDRAKVAKALPPDSTRPLSPAAHSNLISAATELSKHQNLTPATRVTLAKAQLALGQTNAAATNLQHAVKLNPNLKLEPRLRLLNPK